MNRSSASLVSVSHAIAIPLICAALFTQGCKKNPERSSPAFASRPATITEVFSVAKRPDRVPAFSWKDSTGATVSFDAFHGKVTLVNFWATWCGPCKRELPALVELSREYAGRGVKILGVSADRGANIIDDVQAFVRQNGIPYQIVVSNDDLEEAFGNIRGLPTSFIVNEQGNIVQTIVGARDKQFFAQAIDPLLK